MIAGMGHGFGTDRFAYYGGTFKVDTTTSSSMAYDAEDVVIVKSEPVADPSKPHTPRWRPPAPPVRHWTKHRRDLRRARRRPQRSAHRQVARKKKRF
jgi:hypothetical protein